MKKSKLLIPAVGFLMISLAAAGTSTVAWFTSTTAATAAISNIAAAKVDGSLTVYASVDGNITTPAVPKFGTTTSDTEAGADNTAAVSVLTGATLRDASVSMSATGTAHDCYIPKDYDKTTNLPTSYQLISQTTNGSFFSGTVDAAHYSFAKFTLHFKTGSIVNQSIYFNPTSSTVTASDVAISKAVRIGIDDGTDTIIFAPNNTESLTGASAGLDYISAAPSTVSQYTTNVINSTNNDAKTFPLVGTDTAADNARINYLGSVVAGTPKNVDFYVWFEGCDASCTVDNLTATTGVLSATLASSLAFYAVQAYVAA